MAGAFAHYPKNKQFDVPFVGKIWTMNIREPKTIFLDVGGVLLTNGWGHLSRKNAAEQFGIDYQEMEVLHHFIFNIYEIGSITLDEYLDTVIFNHPRRFSRKSFRDFMFDQSKELPNMLPWLKRWKKTCGMRVYALNNEGKELNDFRIEKFGLRECFDGFISSCEVGMRKPDPRLYQLAMRITHTPPGQSLYFDDRVMLVDAAAKLGIRAYHYEIFEKAIVILQNAAYESR